DRNDSGELEGAELLPFAWLVSKAHPPAPPPPAASEPLASPSAPAPPVAQPEVAPGPGGGNHFARLDPSRDGLIDESDLRALQAPARLDLHLRAVLSAMDQDGDGRLAEDEFRAALGDLPR
ncbi:MAG TPA: EF-hand domain-containing protein, partial [Planctomycetota bacterium]